MGRKRSTTTSPRRRGRSSKKHAPTSNEGTASSQPQQEFAPVTLEGPQSQPPAEAGHTPIDLSLGKFSSSMEPLGEPTSAASTLGDITAVQPRLTRKRKISNAVSPDVTMGHRFIENSKELTNDESGSASNKPKRNGKKTKTPADNVAETEAFDHGDPSPLLFPIDESGSGTRSQSGEPENVNESRFEGSRRSNEVEPSGAGTAQFTQAAEKPGLSPYLDKAPARRIPMRNVQEKKTRNQPKVTATAASASECAPSSSSPSEINVDEEVQGDEEDKEQNLQVPDSDIFHDCETQNDETANMEPSSGDGNDLENANGVENEPENTELENDEVDAHGVLESDVHAEFANGNEELNADEDVQADDTGTKRCYIV
ncbi:unnamed protein product [Orchesella dallaii]|uniref:Uncharacterized protein n=1 Tax=Orchesella dallaii TaxID=48710 RepID=A0ABP1QNR7_9HEXA